MHCINGTQEYMWPTGEVEHMMWKVFKMGRVESTLLLGNQETIIESLSSEIERCQRPKTEKNMCMEMVTCALFSF